MRFGSLFSGIGGIDLGLERAGMECVWQVEIDDYASRVLAKHWPDVARFRDVRDCGAHNLEPVDLICGGFPCQPTSIAGKRRGDKDDRWLWPEFIRVVREVRPRWVLAENVLGLLSADAGRLFGGILRDLAESGYDAEWDCIPAAAVGAPHKRDRVFVVGYTQRSRLEEYGHVDAGTEPRAGGENVAHAEEQSIRSRLCTSEPQVQRLGRSRNGCSEVNVADTNEPRLEKRKGKSADNGAQLQTTERSCSNVPNTDCQRCTTSLENRYNASPVFASGGTQIGSHWLPEPNVGRVADGVPNRLDRLRCLGNAVVPQVAEYIGKLIMEANS